MGEELELLKKTGENLAAIVGETSFAKWEERSFRQMVDFDHVQRTEQDRIFNELELTVLGLFVLHLEDAASAKPRMKKIFDILKKEVVEGFINLLANLGLEEHFIEEWRALIQMRLAEYRKDYKLLIKESKDIPELVKNEEFKIIWARIETLTLDGLRHIRRGKLEQEDPLRRDLQKWLIGLDSLAGQITNPETHYPPAEA